MTPPILKRAKLSASLTALYISSASASVFTFSTWLAMVMMGSSSIGFPKFHAALAMTFIALPLWFATRPFIGPVAVDPFPGDVFSGRFQRLPRSTLFPYTALFRSSAAGRLVERAFHSERLQR